MKEVQIRFSFQTEENKKGGIEVTIEYDEIKWKKIKELCEYRKANIYDLLQEYISKITPEEAEEILLSYDM